MRRFDPKSISSL